MCAHNNQEDIMIAEQMEYVASPEMRKFFERLLVIKENLYLHATINGDRSLLEIYQELDKIIKTVE
jgi:hypothetical protein